MHMFKLCNITKKKCTKFHFSSFFFLVSEMEVSYFFCFYFTIFFRFWNLPKNMTKIIMKLFRFVLCTLCTFIHVIVKLGLAHVTSFYEPQKLANKINKLYFIRFILLSKSTIISVENYFEFSFVFKKQKVLSKVSKMISETLC